MEPDDVRDARAEGEEVRSLILWEGRGGVWTGTLVDHPPWNPSWEKSSAILVSIYPNLLDLHRTWWDVSVQKTDQ